MAITYPRAFGVFWETLRFASRPEFALDSRNRQSADGAGNQLSSFRPGAKWTAPLSLAGGRHDRNLTQEADIKHLQGRDGTFLAYDTRRPYPASDPGGIILGASTVQVATKGSNNRSLALKGLPSTFAMTKGDYGSIAYSSGKIFLFQFMESGNASGGVTAELEIQPPLPDGIAVNDAVTLKKPCGKFKLVAGSYRPSSGAGNIASGPSFSMISVP